MDCKTSKIIYIDFPSLIDDYINNHRRCNKPIIKDFKKMKSIDEVIHYAALAIDFDGKRADHHRRRKKEQLELSKKILLHNKKKIASCKDFHTLINLIQNLLNDVNDLGDLYYYDTALEIGFYLNLFPKFIYLHSGTREGAKNLKLNYRKEYLLKDEVPLELKILKEYEIEDFLCIYKDCFPKMLANQPLNRTA
jgi:hypothetical protein